MVKQKKLWAHYKELKYILGIYITLFFVVPYLALSFSGLAHISEVEAGVPGALKTLLLTALKWYGIAMPIVTMYYLIKFFFYSDTVEFTDDSILYYRWIFSKKASRIIPYDKITECVISKGLWKTKRNIPRQIKIILFNKANIIITFDIYGKLALNLALCLGEHRFKLVGENSTLRTIDNHYKIDFMSLNYEEQLKILNHYCSYKGYKTGEKILKKKTNK